MDWHAIRDVFTQVVVPVGGVVALIGGGLTSYHHIIQLRKLRREEAAKVVDARADEILRIAHEVAMRQGGSVMRMVPFELNTELDRKAAWKLCKEGKGRMGDNILTVDVDLMPPMIARDMERRAALRSQDHYH